MVRKKWTKEKIDQELETQIIELRNRNLGYKLIAKELDLKLGAVRWVCLKYGLGGVRSSHTRGSSSEYHKDKKYHNDKKWDKQLIDMEVKKYINEHENLEGLYKNHPSCYYAIIREYGNIKEFYNQNDISISRSGTKYNNTKWNKLRIIEEINKLNSIGFNISHNNIRLNFPKLYQAARRHFGNWENAITSSGLDYEDIMFDVPSTIKAGQEFEFILGEIFEEINVSYTKGYNFEIRPDFVLNDYKWADAKLSRFTIERCKTMEKYEPFVKQLWIIFLLGNKNIDKMISNKTRLTSVYQIIKQLPKHRELYYINKLKEIKESLSEKNIILKSNKIHKQAN